MAERGVSTAGGRLHFFEQTEIADFHVAFFVEQQIVRLEVAVQNAATVGVLQSFQRLAKPAEAAFRRRRPVPLDPAAQVAAGQIFHRHPVERFVGAGAPRLARWKDS